MGAFINTVRNGCSERSSVWRIFLVVIQIKKEIQLKYILKMI